MDIRTGRAIIRTTRCGYGSASLTTFTPNRRRRRCRLGRTSALKEMIEYMKGHEGVWFATGIEIAEWWLEQNFSEKLAPLRIAAAS